MSAPEAAGFEPRRWRIPITIGFALNLAWSAVMLGLRPEHFVVAALFVGLFWYSPRTAKFAWLALPFLLVGIAYDNLRLFIHLRGEVHVDDLFLAERALFGVGSGEARTILPFWFQTRTHAVLDLLCGFAYFFYLWEVFGLGGVLFFKDERLLTRLAWSFLLVNLMGMVTYVLYPAAPPWYVADYGLGPARLDALPSAAGAARFDALIGFGLFESFYSRNANVFGAMPSLHCAYPTVAALVVAPLGRRWWMPAAAFAALVMFSAVYLQHHYVLDVLAGVLYAGLATAVVTAAQRALSARAGAPATAPAEVSG